MDAERWQQIKRVFDVASESSPETLDDVLRAASANDKELAREVRDLLAADSQAESFLESPCVNPARAVPGDALRGAIFHPGQTIADRFEIVRLLGTGGMGQVYEAIDTELGGPIALKTVRPEVSRNHTMLAQFRQEVSVARRITHRNICRTFDIERTKLPATQGAAPEEIAFLTMEYLEGETLQQRMKRIAKLPQGEALAIARQVAEALRAAHQAGVVHRDIKPANVMLVTETGGERVVVTDFGLARFAVAAESRHAGLSKLGVIGTPAYMAPEQMRGATVSTATDIYSFGLVMFEMLTGAPANLEVSADGDVQLRGLPAIASLPPQWQEALVRCLKMIPSDRFANAGELLEFVDSANPSASSAVVQPQTSPARRWIWNAAAVIACVALILAGLRLYQVRRNSEIQAGSRVLFSGVQNQTPDKALDNVAQLMQNQLKQTARFNLMDEDQQHDILQAMTKPPDTPIEGAVAREVAMRGGAVRIVHGEIRRGASPQERVLTMVVEQPDNDPKRARQLWQKQWTWQADSSAGGNGQIPAGLLAAVRDGGDWVRREVGESANDVAQLDASPEDVTTDKWDALAAYTDAQRLYREGKPLPAIVSLRDAVKIDPQFALAWGRMGDILATTNQYQASYQAYSTALQLDQARRLTHRERDRIKGMFAGDTGDFQAAEDAFADMSSFYDKDWLAWFYRARPLLYLGRPKEALHVLLEANQDAPGNIYVLTHLVRTEIVLGDLGGARKWIAELRRTGHEDDAVEMEGLTAMTQGNYAVAKSKFESLEKSADPDYSSWSYAQLARIAAETGDLKAALEYTNHGIDHDSTSGNMEEQDNKLLDRAYLKCQSGDYPGCLADAMDSLGKDVPPQRLRWTANLLSIYASAPGAGRSTFLSALNRVKDRLPKTDFGPLYQLTKLQIIGLDQLARGQDAAALSTLHQADDLDLPTTPRDYLGRALLAVARSAPQTEKAALQAKAAEAFQRGSSGNAMAVESTVTYPPGFFASQQACSMKSTGNNDANTSSKHAGTYGQGMTCMSSN